MPPLRQIRFQKHDPLQLLTINLLQREDYIENEVLEALLATHTHLQTLQHEIFQNLNPFGTDPRRVVARVQIKEKVLKREKYFLFIHGNLF